MCFDDIEQFQRSGLQCEVDLEKGIAIWNEKVADSKIIEQVSRSLVGLPKSRGVLVDLKFSEVKPPEPVAKPKEVPIVKADTLAALLEIKAAEDNRKKMQKEKKRNKLVWKKKKENSKELKKKGRQSNF